MLLPVTPSCPWLRPLSSYEYRTTVRFNGLFKAASGEQWTSSHATVEIVALIDLSTINPADGKIIPAIDTVLNIEIFGQKEKGSPADEYTYPEITDEAAEQIRERILWNYRTFELGWGLEELVERRVGDLPHLAELCERCCRGLRCNSAG